MSRVYPAGWVNGARPIEPVIARGWTGRVPADRSDEYLTYLHATGLREYAETPGHLARRCCGEPPTASPNKGRQPSVTRVAAALAACALLAGCGFGIDFDARPPMPEAPVAMSVYTRGAPEPFTYTYVARSDHSEEYWGDVTVDARGGCFHVGGSWALEVYEGRPGPAGDPIASVEGDAGESPVEIGISVDAAGNVEVTRGRPEWWTAEPQTCGE